MKRGQCEGMEGGGEGEMNYATKPGRRNENMTTTTSKEIKSVSQPVFACENIKVYRTVLKGGGGGEWCGAC